MSAASDEPPRVAWLDGLRGVAASQVVLLHYASAFLPAIGLQDPALIRHAWQIFFIGTPLFLPFNGFAAVALFFVLSGVALTWSFSTRPAALLGWTVRRAIRLGIPMAGALALGAVWFGIWPQAHIAASQLSGSEAWLGIGGTVILSPAALAHQVFLEGLFAGYSGKSVLPGFLQQLLVLTNTDHSYDAPINTLHAEMFGSLIVLGLVAVRHRIRKRIYVTVCAILLAGMGFSFAALFTIGHVAANWLRRGAGRHLLVGGVALVAGAVLSTADPRTVAACLPLPKSFANPATVFGAQSMFGATAMFFGIACLPPLRALLARPFFRWLGRISFSLYLVHFPILYTAMAAWFTVLAGQQPYMSAFFTVLLGGCAASVAVAVVFEKWIDRPAIALSRRAFYAIERQPAVPAFPADRTQPLPSVERRPSP